MMGGMWCPHLTQAENDLTLAGRTANGGPLMSRQAYKLNDMIGLMTHIHIGQQRR